MEISQVRKEFSIFVVDSDVATGPALTEAIKAAGYEDTQFYPTLEAALAIADQTPPHIVLFNLERFESVADQSLVDLASISDEILVILTVSPKQVLPALQYVSRGLAYDSIVRPFVSTLEIIQKLDRAAERLYFQFESEQIREYFEGGGMSPTVPTQQIPSGGGSEAGDAPVEADFSDLNEYLTKMMATKDIDQSIQIFMDAMSRKAFDTPVLYFRYVPSHVSLLVSQASWLPVEKFRGVGLDLSKEDPTRLQDYLSHPDRLESLRGLISEVFRKEKFTAFPNVSDGEVLGIFVVLDQIDVSTSRSGILPLRRIFEIAFKRNHLMKEKHALDITDPLTGFFNRKHFAQKLDEEISRSRRIMMPVSLVTLDIDGISRLNERLGRQQTDAILKTVAMILKKTARTNDILARTGPDEFVCILPHTGHMGAAVKAERMRRIIESTRFPLLEKLEAGPLTMSLGVSEYPSFSNDAEGLVRTADEALMQVRKAGGNRVCLATAPPGFQIDFVPREVSSGPPIHGEGAR